MAYDNNIYARIISGEVTDEEVTQLKSTGEWDEIQKILTVTDSFSLPQRDLEHRYQNLTQRKSLIQKSTNKIIHLKKLLGVAAIFVVTIGAGLLLFGGSSSHTAPYGSHLAVVLPDQSTVILNDGSNITYARTFDNDREVRLTGEALFEVETGASFTVKTERGQVTVLGTQFNVNAWSDGMIVECYEGRVEVASDRGIVVLEAGQMIDFNLSGDHVPTLISRSSPDWVQGQSRFVDRPLREVANEMERQFDISIDLQVPLRKFSGVFDHQSLEVALEQVCLPLGLRFEVAQDGTVTISE